MKCLIIVCFLVFYLTVCCEAGALRCPPGALDPVCMEEKKEDDTQDSENSGSTTTDVQCLAGTEWESNCHYCRCSDSGIAECLKQDLCDNPIFAEPAVCKPNTTFQRDCNTCICLDNGLGLCTLESCRRSDIPIELTDLTEKEDSEKENTNNSDKTDVVAPVQNKDSCDEPTHVNIFKRSAMVCKPLERFNKDCNPCQCAANGLSYSCTNNECLEADMDKDVEVFKQNEGVHYIERHSVCRARNTFYIGCNACNCNSLGTDYTCTQKLCPLPADVEIFRDIKDIKPASTDDDLEMLKA